METTAASPWLNAWYDPLAGVKTTTQCVQMADLSADGDSKLLICDSSKKLKVYRGTALAMETDLLDYPVAAAVTYAEIATPRIPSISVAAGSYVFIYRQLRPYRKWTCPPMEISPAETEVWTDLKMDLVDIPGAIQRLIAARDSGVVLTARSADLIGMDDESEAGVAKRTSFVNDMNVVVPYVQQTLITCMDVLKKDSDDSDAISLLVVGTESGIVYILPQDPSNSNYLCKVALPTSAPVSFSITGLFDVDWRILVACRDGKMYTIKSGDVRGTAVLTGSAFDAGCQITAVAKQDKFLWVSTMDKLLSCYSFKGKRTAAIVLNEDVVELTSICIRRAKTSHLLLVALASGEIRMYKELKLFHSFTVEKPVQAMKFGAYGREDNSLVIVHGKGSLTFKILKRLVDLESGAGSALGAPKEQEVPLSIPKKTKLYVEQTQRERELASDIHRSFQKDLCRLRLETARAYVKTLTDGHLMGITTMGSADVRIQVQVQGLGPKFVLRVTLQATGTHPVLQTRLIFSYNTDYYIMGHCPESQQSIAVPILLPGPKHVIETQILNTDAQGRAGQVVVMLTHGLLSTGGANVVSAGVASTGSGAPMAGAAAGGSFVPILFATVRMPVSELLDA